jgi:predicted nucleic acid-binding protein
MARELFVDTSGFFALLAKRDPQHRAAQRILAEAQAEKRRLITTDYVLDETATLLKARGEARLVEPLFERVLESAACRIEWMDAARFDKTRSYFCKHADQAWSFTDCVSFQIMKELRLSEALTTDLHFEQAGFKALLKPH